MKKLAAIAVLTAALATPAAAQYVYPMSPDRYYWSEPRGFDEVYIYHGPTVYGSPTPLLTQRGLMNDPDPHVRSQIQRNYNFYMNLNGG